MNEPALLLPARTSISALWRSALPSPLEERRARRRLHLKAWLIAAIVAGSYFVLVVTDVALWLRFVAAIVLAMALVAVGTGVMHDANHGSFSAHRWVNRMLCYTSDALGASSWLWRMQHNGLHHGNTNVAGFDADIALAPFARLAPTQPWRWWHRAQHIYIWPLYGFLTLKNLLVSDFVALATKRLDVQPLPRPVTPAVVARIAAGKVVHIAWAVVLPLAFNPWWTVLAFYLGCSWVVGFTLAITFQLAHCVDIAEFPEADSPRRGDDFVVHQLRTTCDIATPMPIVGPFLRWLVGGLDHQIEHHLAPRLPHTVYGKVATRFRDLCRLYDIEYRQHPGVWAALRSHTRWLRRMGARVVLARAEPATV